MFDELRYRVEELQEYVVRFFTRFGAPEEDARVVAEVMLSADLRGVESHGISKLYVYYGNRLRGGCIDVRTPTRVLQETDTSLVIDGGNGLGHVVGHRVMSRCIQKAAESGLCMATARNSNHYGIAGYYAMMALPHDMIGLSLTNSEALVAPTFGRKRILGTNPIAVAVPAGRRRPYVLDMATSIKPLGNLLVREAKGQEIPLGWGMNAAGELTTDPAEVHRGGALLPLGGTELMSGYKGYGLALLVDILSGVLAGAGFGPGVGSPLSDQGPPADVGHFFMALKIEAFRPLAEFKADMDRLLERLVGSPKVQGEERIFIHGEKEFEFAERCRREGVPIAAAVVDQLRRSGEEFGVPFDLEPVRG